MDATNGFLIIPERLRRHGSPYFKIRISWSQIQKHLLTIFKLVLKIINRKNKVWLIRAYLEAYIKLTC